jgi:hypothetical protein
MDLGKNADRARDDVTTQATSWFRTCEGMALWRWLLFAVMARFEVDEGVYLRIPSGRVTRCGVSATASTRGSST